MSLFQASNVFGSLWASSPQLEVLSPTILICRSP